MGSIAAVVTLVIVIMACVIPTPEGSVCDEINYVSSSNQSICSYYQGRVSLDNKAYFQSSNDDITAYQYDVAKYFRLPMNTQSITHKIDTYVSGKDYRVLFVGTFGPEHQIYPSSLFLNFTMSDELTLALVRYRDEYDVNRIAKSLVSSSISPNIYCEIIGTDVKKVVKLLQYNVNYHSQFHLVAANPHANSVSIEGTSVHTYTTRIMNSDEAIKVCKKDCSFSNPETTKIVLSYTGESNSVKVSMTISDYISDFVDVFICTVPAVFFAVVVPVIVLFTLKLSAPDANASGSVEMKEAQIESGVPQQPAGVDPSIPYPGQDSPI